jgi:hypothetical protein
MSMRGLNPPSEIGMMIETAILSIAEFLTAGE